MPFMNGALKMTLVCVCPGWFHGDFNGIFIINGHSLPVWYTAKNLGLESMM